MKVLIIEDDMQQARHLEDLLREIDSRIDIRGPLFTVHEAAAYLTNFQMPDLCFAKSRLADGLFYSALLSTGCTAPVAYMAQDSTYAVEAFRHNGLAYLLKPLDKEGVALTLQKWMDFVRHAASGTLLPNDEQEAIPPHPCDPHCPNPCLTPGQPLCTSHSKSKTGTSITNRQRIMVARASQYEVFSTRKVAYFELNKEQVSAFMEDGTQVPVRATLEDIERQLDPERFFRTNRQTLVSIHQVEHFANHHRGKLLVYLKDFPKKVISVSKEKAALFKKWIDN